jgi:hypothetical protein
MRMCSGVWWKPNLPFRSIVFERPSRAHVFVYVSMRVCLEVCFARAVCSFVYTICVAYLCVYAGMWACVSVCLCVVYCVYA